VAVRGDDSLARATIAERLVGSGLFSRVVSLEGLVGPSQGEWSCLVWDAGLEPRRALAALAERPADDTPILMLVPDPEAGLLATTSGARGAIRRDASVTLLVASTLAVAAGASVVEPAHLSLLRPEGPAAAEALETLTPREREVLELLAQGLSNRAIAGQLAISEHTAKFHVTSLMGKLGAQKRVEAVVRAARMGIIDL
jgi:two-component system nitrate/nitrite response regulator NarL